MPPVSGLAESEPLVIGVALAIPLRKLFDYLLPADYPVQPQIGMRVEVPFGKRFLYGLVSRVGQVSADLTIDQLKPIHRFLDQEPLVGQSLCDLQAWMVKYYHAPPGEVWQTMLPGSLLKGDPVQIARTSCWQISEKGRLALSEGSLKKSAVKQKQLLTFLQGRATGLAHDQLKVHGFSYALLKTAAGKGWVNQTFEVSAPVGDELVKPSPISLNPQQAEAVNQVTQALGSYQSFLLFGVTASGKTEVYMQVIEQVLKRGLQALVLIPEIGLTPQTLSRFTRRFAVEIVTLHSGMSDGQRLQAWLKAKQGMAQIVIGTRSALFTPLKHPGVIIIDEEHDRSFRQHQGFRYSARDVAMVRGSLENIPVLMGSATPSMETLINVNKAKVQLLSLPHKAATSQTLDFKVLDLKNQIMQNGLSNDLVKAIHRHLAAKGQVLLFLNRRGFAPVLLCHQCGWSGRCQRCDLHFTYHQQQGYLLCHHCGSGRKAPQQCPECHCPQMVPIGLGTERLQQTIAELFPDAKIARIDRDTTRTKSAMTDLVDSVKAGELDILIGTQMLAKGHHFPNVTLVGLVDMDGALYSADFRAPEYAAQLLTQVSGRAGRADRKGEVLVQTHHADHPMLKQVITQGYQAFAEMTLQERLDAELPPYAFAALFQAESPSVEPGKQFLSEVHQLLSRSRHSQVELCGPAPAVYAKKAGKFRYQLFVQSSSRHLLHQLLDQTLTEIENLKSARQVRWRLEIDPASD